MLHYISHLGKAQYTPVTSEPTGSRTSGGGNNGVRTGSYGFHTDLETQPWWAIDLLGRYYIEAIHIYNRRDKRIDS
jgi:hypothetical protein